jgi:hypothetical protein
MACGIVRAGDTKAMRHLGWACASLLAAALMASAPVRASTLIMIDKSTQQMSVVVDGQLRWQWRVSTGAPGYDTPSGTFHAFRMEASHFSKEFDDAPMPHSIFFTPRGHAVHGYLNTSHLGSPVSHGCVRLDPQNAAALYALVRQEGVRNTTVVVTGHVSGAVAPTPPSYPQSAPYGGPYSGDDRFMPPTNYGGPPQPPPGYPPFPRPY